MNSDNSDNWSNYWQGRANKASDTWSGEAWVGEAWVGIEQNTQLDAFWAKAFKDRDQQIAILDLACGAGSVLRHADRLGFSNLNGLDISEHAIKTMQERFNMAKGIVASVANTGLNDGSFDMIVSQFGFEYAGDIEAQKDTCQEIARLLKPKGEFVALCHIKDGAISDEVQLHLRQIETIENTDFIKASKTVFRALDRLENHADEQAANLYNQAVTNLAQPREKLNEFIAKSAGQIQALAKHLLMGTAQLFEKRKAYNLDDIIGWLDGMEAEIRAYKGRMRSQQNAAISEQGIEELSQALSEAGLKCTEIEKLFLEQDSKPSAWVLQAEKPK